MNPAASTLLRHHRNLFSWIKNCKQDKINIQYVNSLRIYANEVFGWNFSWDFLLSGDVIKFNFLYYAGRRGRIELNIIKWSNMLVCRLYRILINYQISLLLPFDCHWSRNLCEFMDNVGWIVNESGWLVCAWKDTHSLIFLKFYFHNLIEKLFNWIFINKFIIYFVNLGCLVDDKKIHLFFPCL